MSYPTAIPSYGDTTGSQTLATAGGVGLSAILDTYGIDIIAAATKIGTGASTPTLNKVLTGSGVGTSAWSSTLAGLTLTAPAMTTPYVSNGIIDITGSSGNLRINSSSDGGEYNIGVDTTGTLAFFGAASATLNLKLLDGILYTDTIAETTADNGVKIDEVKILDSTIKPDSASTNVDLDLRGKGTGILKSNGIKLIQGYDYVVSGCVWSGDAYGSTRAATMSAGTVVINGNLLTVAAVTSRTFTASKDVYVDLVDNGDGTAEPVYYDNTTNAASPSFATTTGTMRIAIVVVGASSIAAATSINQGQPERSVPTTCNIGRAGIDSLGNSIRRRDPYRPLIFTKNSTLQGDGDVLSLTLPLLVDSLLVIQGNQSGEWVNTPSIDTYSNLYVDGSNIQQNRIDTDGTGKVWTSYPHAYQASVSSGSRIVKLNNSHGGGGNAQYVSAALIIWAYPS